MIPKLIFRKSWIYERVLLRILKESNIQKMDDELFLNTWNELKLQEKFFEKVILEISSILNVKWKRSEIAVYPLPFSFKDSSAFSDPLSICLCHKNGKPRSIETLIDTLSHELIHNALIDHDGTISAVKQLKVDFPNEDIVTYNHVFVHAVHYFVYEKLNRHEMYEKDKEFCKKYSPLYYRAWQIVDEVGAKTMLDKYFFS